MKLLTNNFIKRIIVIVSVIIMLTFFCLTPSANAATQTKMDEGEFYYAGTTQGAYVVTEGVFSWLLSKIGDIADFLIGLFTMGGRMVFVGWTALLEEILTGVLEATTGVPMITDADSTQMDGMIKSSNNVTLEAIVYNKVPVLNINLFDDDPYNKCISGTGQYWVECETCSQEHGLDDLCRMEDCNCTECTDYINSKGLNDINVISIIRDSVRMWYYAMRLIAMAGMLLVLMFLGIKGATTTVAQDKAVYKRMLFDWVVGVLILFFIQYIMIMIINFNESMVDIIKDVQTGITEITMKEFNVEKKSNQDLEISIYEAVRTRAYDAKLMNGTLGMILYISLVFMAIKYTFIYAKRYFAVIVLTLMAPGVAFSYAIQKVLSGKSAAFSKWMQEYFVNVIIQTIHALIYTVFITMILVISLNSISGMIIALVIMNFMGKVEPIFRKIFKMNGSIADDAEKNSNPRALMQKAKTAAGFMTANKLLSKSPIAKAVKAPLKATGVGAVMAASNIDDKFFKKRREEKAEKKAAENNEAIQSVYNELKEHRESLQGTSAVSSFTQVSQEYEDNKENSIYLNLEAQEAMEKELADLEKSAYEAVLNGGGKEAEERYEKIKATREKFDNATTLSASQIFGAHISKFLNKDNYYKEEYKEKDIQREMKKLDGLDIKRNENENDEEFEARKEKTLREQAVSKVKPKRVKRESYFGRYGYDPNKDEFVRHSMGTLIAQQMKSENLLGLSDADKKVLKEITAFGKEALVGMGSVFIGLGTIATEPGVGFGLLAKGIDSRVKFDVAMGRGEKRVKPPIVSDKNKKYSFGRFNKGAKQTLVKAAIAQAEGEKNKAVVANVQKNHTKLYNTLRFGGLGLTVVGAATLAPMMTPFAAGAMLGATSTNYIVGKMGARYQGFTRKGLMGKLSKQHFKQYEARKKDLITDQIRDDAIETTNEFNKNYVQVIAVFDEIIKNLEEEEEKRRKEEAEERERREQEKEAAALASGDAIKVSDGTVIKIDYKDGKKEEEIIEEAIAEVILQKAVSAEIIMQSFGNEADLEDIERLVTQKLKMQGLSLDSSDEILKNKILKKIKEITVEEPSSIETGKKGSDLITNDGTEGDKRTEAKPTNPVGIGSMYTDKNGTSGSESSAESKSTSKALKMIEKTLVKQVIREMIQSGEVARVSDITQEMVEKAVIERKAKIVSTQEKKRDERIAKNREENTANVISKLGQQRKDATDDTTIEKTFLGGRDSKGTSASEINLDGSRSARDTFNSEVKPEQKQVTLLDLFNSKTADGSQRLNNSRDGSVVVNGATDGSRIVGAKNTSASGNNASEILGIDAELSGSIQATINEIKGINAPTQKPTQTKTTTPKTAAERRKEKQKRIAALDQILTEGALGEGDLFAYQKNVSQNPEDATSATKTEPKTSDQIVQELLSQTTSGTMTNDMLVEKLLRESEAGKELVRNMKQMRTLNRRAERMKMTTRNSKYHVTKGYEEEDKARAKYPGIGQDISSGEQAVKKTDRKVPGKKETYGPAIDVVDLIKKQSEIRMKKIEF